MRVITFLLFLNVLAAAKAARMSLYDGFLQTTTPSEPGMGPLENDIFEEYGETQDSVEPDFFEPSPTEPLQMESFINSSTISTSTEPSPNEPLPMESSFINTTISTGDEYDDYEADNERVLSDVQSLINDLISSGNSKKEKEGDVRLVEGRDKYEGNLEIFHDGRWGSVCDDEWDMYDAIVVCKQLGFGKPKRYYHSSQFGYSKRLIHMDNLYCYGTESRLEDCRFNGWGDHDCERTEGAGLRCNQPPPPPTTPPPITTPRPQIKRDFRIRLSGGRVKEEGRVEVSFEGSKDWSPVCGDGWDLQGAMVACKELGLKYAQSAFQTHLFSQPLENDETNFTVTPGISGITCKGHENRLSDCYHDEDIYCPGSGSRDVAGIVCVDEQADLAIDVYALVSSTHLEDKSLFSLSCAMEENCLASEAYSLRLNNPNYHLEVRRLLRFTTSIENIGNADFRPLIPKSHWEWHACHAHYHSMEVFAHFDIFNADGAKVAEGHKASFCLEDRECYGVDPKYNCENYGDQGISPGCKDIYYHNIDCQWLDMTEVDPGTYTFRMAINPEYKVAEQSFENNAVTCILTYTQQYAMMSHCNVTRP